VKKILFLIVLFIAAFTLFACDPGEYNFDYNELIDSVVSIELIQYDNLEQKQFVSWVPNHFSKLLAFELSHMRVLETLPNDNVIDFLSQLSQVHFLYKYYVYNSPKDICIRIIYANDDFQILSIDYKNFGYGGYIGRYNSDGNVVDFIGSFESYYDFEALVNNFFETKINE
jgi:hypothetical protein